MENDMTLRVVSLVLVFMGLVSAWKGDVELPEKGIFGVRIRTYKKGFMRWFKWVFAAAFLYVGFSILSRTG